MNGQQQRWHRNIWLEAVWSSQLRPLERLVAAVYADHARDQREAWLTLDRLCERTGLSRDAANRARLALIDACWLVQISKPNRRRAAVFALVIPDASSPGDVLLSSTAGRPLSSPSPDASSPPDVPEQSASRTEPKYLPQNKPQSRNGSDPMSDRAEPTDEALAAFSASHPGRERDALTAALKFYERTKGEPCKHPAAYFGSWTVDDLQARIKLAQPPKCPDCLDEGWLYRETETGAEPIGKCSHPKKAAVS